MHVREQVPDLIGPALMPDGTFGEIRLHDPGHWTILFFYPADFTYVCPTEIQAFVDAHETFAASGSRIIGASGDSVYAHLAWVERDFGGRLPFALLGDINRQWATVFDVMNQEEGIALRATFIVDPAGTLRMAHVADTDVGRNVQEIVRQLEALKSGGLCPAGWRPGEPHVGPAHAHEHPRHETHEHSRH